MKKTLFGVVVVGLFLAFGALPPASSAKDDVIRIGLFGPLTGKFSGLGVDGQKGCELAVREINQAGGINGKKVQLFIYDDRGDRKEAVSVVRKMIEMDKVVAIVDGSLSLTSIAAAPVVNSAKIPMVVAYSNAVGVVKGHEYCFRWASVADVQGWIMAHHAVKKKNFKNFALFIQDEEYGRGIGNGMVKGLEKLGANIAYQRFFSPGEKEFRSYLTAAKEKNPDAVFVSGFGPSLAGIQLQGYDLGLFPKAQYYGGCDMTEMDWFNGVGTKGNGAIGILEFITGVDNAFTKEFVKKWTKEFNTSIVSHEAGLTYDAARLLFDAIKRGGATPEGIRKALSETKEFKNLSGVPVKFTELREPELPLAIGVYDDAIKDFKLLEYVTDPALIDPRPWYQYYK
jgi:branched-chain amino acid transport system substrate-binding protein